MVSENARGTPLTGYASEKLPVTCAASAAMPICLTRCLGVLLASPGTTPPHEAADSPAGQAADDLRRLQPLPHVEIRGRLVKHINVSVPAAVGVVQSTEGNRRVRRRGECRRHPPSISAPAVASPHSATHCTAINAIANRCNSPPDNWSMSRVCKWSSCSSVRMRSAILRSSCSSNANNAINDDHGVNNKTEGGCQCAANNDAQDDEPNDASGPLRAYCQIRNFSVHCVPAYHHHECNLSPSPGSADRLCP